MRPDDSQVHKYAGQLLFQNGAFQDALSAFSHQPILLIPSNFDIFLTQAKSLFLIGRFQQASKCFSEANRLQTTKQIEFDIKVLQFLHLLTSDPFDTDNLLKKLSETYSTQQKQGKIFKLNDQHIFYGIINIYAQRYDQALKNFEKAIQQKQRQLGQQQQQQSLIQNKKDLQSYTSQINYNIILCCLGIKNYQLASKKCSLIVVSMDQPHYGDYINFKKFINRQIQLFKKQQVFSSKNKLSNFLPHLQFRVKSKTKQEEIICWFKLCIPFPKVQPPQIFPNFDQSLIKNLSVLNVDRKPEAPWITRQSNSIKFTDQIRTYSRFQIESSQGDSSSTYQLGQPDRSHLASNRSRILSSKQMTKMLDFTP